MKVLGQLKEAQIAKNYLTEKELQGLNQLVSGYLDFAKRQAQREVPMTMADWIKHIDAILSATGEAVLQDKGHISHQQMQAKVLSEYQKYQSQTISSVERDYLREIRVLDTYVKKAVNSFTCERGILWICIVFSYYFPAFSCCTNLRRYFCFPALWIETRNCNDDFYRGRLHLSESMQSSIRNSYSC